MIKGLLSEEYIRDSIVSSYSGNLAQDKDHDVTWLEDQFLYNLNNFDIAFNDQDLKYAKSVISEIKEFVENGYNEHDEEFILKFLD